MAVSGSSARVPSEGDPRGARLWFALKSDKSLQKAAVSTLAIDAACECTISNGIDAVGGLDCP